MAARTLWKFVVGRAKTIFKNYNCVNKADKVMGEIKKSPPRHPGTEAKFKVLIKERPEILESMEKKPVELLDRLKIVKVSSEGPQDDEQGTKPLPQRRVHEPPPTYGFEEPKIVPEGKCTLRQALEFLTNHQNDPSVSKIDSIAKEYKMKTSDVENVMSHFRVFELYIPKNKPGLSDPMLKAIGVKRTKKELFAEPLENVKPGSEALAEEKK